jgi:hypothetical protein
MEPGVRHLISEIDAVAGQVGVFRQAPNVAEDNACRVGSGRYTANPPLNFPDFGCRSLTNPEGQSACWSGTTYETWREYNSICDAVRYLKRYFIVIADPHNNNYNQIFINNC